MAEKRTDGGSGGKAGAGNGTDGLSYEQARDELADVVRRLEAGGVTLEESLALWERGEALADVCQQWLDGARKKLAEARADQPQSSDDVS